MTFCGHTGERYRSTAGNRVFWGDTEHSAKQFSSDSLDHCRLFNCTASCGQLLGARFGNTFPFCFPNAPILKSLCFFGSSQQQPFVFLIGFFRGWAATSYVQGLYSLTVEGGLRTSWLVVNYNSITTFLQRWKTWCGFAMMLMHAI